MIHWFFDRGTNIGLSTGSFLVPATERAYWRTFVMEYLKFSLIDVDQNDVADYTNMCRIITCSDQ